MKILYKNLTFLYLDQKCRMKCIFKCRNGFIILNVKNDEIFFSHKNTCHISFVKNYICINMFAKFEFVQSVGNIVSKPFLNVVFCVLPSSKGYCFKPLFCDCKQHLLCSQPRWSTTEPELAKCDTRCSTCNFSRIDFVYISFRVVTSYAL